MKITIVYDNVVWDPILKADWGFACLVETGDRNLLFDTGANGSILLSNMKKLGIDPTSIDAVFISHSHWDHIGGLDDLLKRQPLTVFLPADCPAPAHAARIVPVGSPMEIFDSCYSTGSLDGIEQSLVLRQKNRTIVVAGCSHPGVGKILSAAARFGSVTALIGGLHGFDEFSLIERLDAVCPAHCTRHIHTIAQRYPRQYMAAGAGRVLQF